MPAEFACVVAALLVALVQDPREAAFLDLDARMRKTFVRASESDLSIYSVRLRAALAKLPSEQAMMCSAVDRFGAVLVEAGIHLDAVDQYRQLVPEHPELEVLVLPNEHYRDSYNHGLSIIEVESATVASTPKPNANARAAIERQLDETARYARGLLVDRMQGLGGEQLLDESLSSIIMELKGGIGEPFWGLFRPLNVEEIASIRAKIAEHTAETPVVYLEAWALMNPLPEDESNPNFLTDIALAREVLDTALQDFYLFTKYTHPKSGELFDRLHAVIETSASWMAEHQTKHLDLYVKTTDQPNLRVDQPSFTGRNTSPSSIISEDADSLTAHPSPRSTPSIDEHDQHGQAREDDQFPLFMLLLVILAPITGIAVLVYHSLTRRG